MSTIHVNRRGQLRNTLVKFLPRNLRIKLNDGVNLDSRITKFCYCG